MIGIKDTSASRIRVKGHAARLGLDVSHVSIHRKAGPPIDLYAVPPQRKMLRVAAASIAAAWFLLRGYSTAIPAEPGSVDMVHRRDGRRLTSVRCLLRERLIPWCVTWDTSRITS